MVMGANWVSKFTFKTLLGRSEEEDVGSNYVDLADKK